MANHGITSQRQRELLLDLALAGARGISVRGLYERLTRLVAEVCPGARVVLLVPEPAPETYAVFSDQPLPLSADVPPLPLNGEPDALRAAVAERMGVDPGNARLVPVAGEPHPGYLVVAGNAGGEAEAFCKAVTEIFAAALAREMAASAAERSAGRAAALHDLALLLHQGQPVESLFDRLLALLDSALECDFAGMLRPGASPGVFDGIASSEIPELNRTGWTPEVAQVDRLMATAESVTQWRPDRIVGAAPAALAAAGIKMVATSLLRSEGEVIGLFSVGRRSGGRFSEEECQFIEQVAALLSQAVAIRKRVEAANAAAARAHTLAELALLLDANEPLERLFERLRDGMGRAIDFDYVGLALPSSAPEMFQVVQSGLGRPPSVMLERARTGWDSLLGRGQDLTQFALAEEKGGLVPNFLRDGMRRSLVAILRYRGEPLGLLHLSRARPEPFSSDEIAFLNVLRTLFAQALANQQRMQQAVTEAHRQRLLNQLSLLVNEGEPTGTVFGRVKTLIQEAVDVDFVGLVVTRPEDDMAELIGADRVAPEGPRRLVPAAASGIWQVAGTNERVYQFEPQAIDLPICQQLAERGIAHAASVVLRDGTVPIGMLTFGRRRKAPFESEDTALMDVVATLLGQAVANQLRMRRAEIEAEDQALIGAIGAAAATETDPSRLVDFLNEALRKRIPEAMVGFGFLEGDEIVSPLANWRMYRQPVTPVTRRAEAEGQVVGRWSDDLVLPTSPMYGVGLQVGALTVARLSGSTVGFLLVATKSPDYRFSERELRLFRLLAQLVGPAVQNLRAAARTARERALYDLALQSLSEAVVLVDHDLRAVFANPGGEALVEAVRTNRDDEPGALPDIGDYARRVFREALQFGVRHRGLTQLEMHGELVWLEFEAIPLEHPAYRLLVVASDVTAKVRREAEERRHREELDEASRRTEADRALRNLILDSLSEAVVLVEEEGLRVAYANPHGRELVERIEDGRRLDHLKELLDFLPEDAREHFRAAFGEGRRAAFRSSLEINGEVRWYDVELIPVRLEQPQILIVAADVTSTVQREAELQQHRERMEQAARLAALGELISGVAHELNNPLTAILGFAELLASSPAADSMREELGVIQKEALRARDVVRDLLFIARPGAVERSEVDVRDIVVHIERIRRTAWQQQGIDVRIDTGAVTAPVWGNEHQLTQVLLNLVTNAEQALATVAEPRITIRAETTPEGLVVSVADNGPGMDAATRARVFEPFFTTKPGVGTGLGLSLSYTMMAAHHGRLEVDSAPGKGTTFRMVLPRPAHLEAAAADTGEQEHRPYRVLVIDDEPNLRKVCKRLIVSLGHECATADTAQAALALLESAPFDLVLCDYRLAAETAEAVVQGIMARQPAALARVVIATGATTDPGVVALTERHGLRLLPKPYGVDQIERLLSDRAA